MSKIARASDCLGMSDTVSCDTLAMMPLCVKVLGMHRAASLQTCHTTQCYLTFDRSAYYNQTHGEQIQHSEDVVQHRGFFDAKSEQSCQIESSVSAPQAIGHPPK